MVIQDRFIEAMGEGYNHPTMTKAHKTICRDMFYMGFIDCFFLFKDIAESDDDENDKEYFYELMSDISNFMQDRIIKMEKAKNAK